MASAAWLSLALWDPVNASSWAHLDFWNVSSERHPLPKFFPSSFGLLNCVVREVLSLNFSPTCFDFWTVSLGWRLPVARALLGALEVPVEQCRLWVLVLLSVSARPFPALPSALTCTDLPQLVCFTHCLIYISGKLYTTNGSNSSSSSSHHHAAVCGALYPELRSRPAGAGRTDGCSTGNCLPWLCSLTEFLF